MTPICSALTVALVLSADPAPAVPEVGGVARLGGWLTGHWPVLAAAAVCAALVLGAVAVWLGARSRRADAASAAGGVWLRVQPPAGLPGDAALALWQALAGVLRRARPAHLPPATRRRRSGAARPGVIWGRPVSIAAEFVADHRRVHAGIWVPPGLSAASVARAVRHAWPGSLVEPAGHGPTWVTRCANPAPKPVGPAPKPVGAVEVAELRPAEQWAPLIDPTAAAGNRPGASSTVMGAERLRGVLAGLGARAPGEHACAQLVITRHRHRGWPVTWWSSRLVIAVLLIAARMLVEAVEVLTTSPRASGRAGSRRAASGTVTGSSSRPGVSSAVDPAAAAAGKARDAKRAAGPHLHATLRVALRTRDTPTRRRRIRRRAVADIAAGYDLTTTALRTHHQRPRAARAFGARRPGGGFAATLPELAALFHPPTEPARYNLPAPRARTRPPGHDITHRAPDAPTGTRAVRTSGHDDAVGERDHRHRQQARRPARARPGARPDITPRPPRPTQRPRPERPVHPGGSS